MKSEAGTGSKTACFYQSVKGVIIAVEKIIYIINYVNSTRYNEMFAMIYIISGNFLPKYDISPCCVIFAVELQSIDQSSLMMNPYRILRLRQD